MKPADIDSAINFLKQSDPVLGRIIDRIGECRLIQPREAGDLFSYLAETIIHQQLSTKVAAVIHRRFTQLYPSEPFPSPAAVLATPDEVLRGAGISRAKILYLKDLAQKVEAGLPTIEALEQLDDETIIKTLTQVKGIGRWSAQMLLLFRLHRPDVLPVDDLGLRTAILKAYDLEILPSKKAIEALAQSWRPYCSVASWYLWAYLDNK